MKPGQKITCRMAGPSGAVFNAVYEVLEVTPCAGGMKVTATLLSVGWENQEGTEEKPDFEAASALMSTPLVAATYKDAGHGVMFPRTIDPNAPTPPKPPSSLPKAAPDLPAVTRTGTAKAGAQKAKLVPCSKSKWHKHHPEDEECPECDPPAARKTEPDLYKQYQDMMNDMAKKWSFGFPVASSAPGPAVSPTGHLPPTTTPTYILVKPTFIHPGSYRGWDLEKKSGPAGSARVTANKRFSVFTTTFKFGDLAEENKAYEYITKNIDQIEGP